MMNGVRAVLYRELNIYKRRLFRYLASYTVSPFLFLLVFGWGVGRHVEIDGMTYLAFMLPGLATMAAMTQSYGMSTEMNISRFYLRVFEEFQMAPVAAWEIVLGEVLYGMMRGTLAAIAVFAMGTLFGTFIIPGPLAIVFYLLHTFIFSCAAVVAAMVVRGHADQGNINTFFIVPMSFLCGTFFPLERLPHWAYLLANALPLTHSNIIIRSTFANAPLPIANVVAVVGFAVVFFCLAVHFVRRASI